MERNVLVNLLHVKKYYVKKKRFFHKPATYTKAVDDITLQIYEGETLGIVGESGCGKSTLGKLFVGLEPVSDGEIFYKNENIQKKEIKKKNRTNIQMVFQNTSASLNPRKKIYDLLYAPLHYHHIVPKTNINQEIDRLLNLVGLNSNMKKRFPHEFSGGQRQRIGIARALSVKPKFVVWDEPVSALDASVLASILNLIKHLQKELDLTSVFIGHGLTSVRYVSDRIAVMYLGKIVEIAKADEIFKHPIHPYTKALFSAAPILDPKKRAKDRFILTGEVMAEEKDLLGEPTKGCIFYSRCPFAQSFCKEQPMQLALLEEVANAYDAHYCACPVKMKEEEI